MNNKYDWSVEFPKQRFTGRAYGLYSAICKKYDTSILDMPKIIAQIKYNFGIGYEMLLYAKEENFASKVIQELYYCSSKRQTMNSELFIRGFKEGYTLYKNSNCFDLLLKDIDLPCKIITSNQEKLYFAEGNVFATDGFGFDGVAVFLPNGMYMINGDYKRFQFANPDNIVAAIYDFHNQPNLSLQDIPFAVNTILDMLQVHNCKRIGFHGIKINGVNDFFAESYTIRAVSNWLSNHLDSIESITMVDRYDSYSKHQ